MGFFGFEDIVGELDNAIISVFSQWNWYSTALITILLAFVTYQIITSRDPDTHPGMFARQASVSHVRQEGESAVYRSRYVPDVMPLTTGLDIKDPGAAKWIRGRDGDLRDVWRRVVTGAPEDGPGAGQKGRILTVLGSDNSVEHKLDEMTRQINLVGQHISKQGGSRVAVYLPNSVELITTIFACSFYDLTPIILPFDQPDDHVVDMLRRSGADTVVTSPGSFPFDLILQAYPTLHGLVWVVDEGNKHLDWNEVPKGMGSRVSVATWADILVDNPPAAGVDLPELSAAPPKDIITFWNRAAEEQEEMVAFSHANIAAGIAGQLAAIPAADQFSPAAMFLPADSLSNIHTLVLTLSALFANASVAFNSVAGGSDDLVLASQGVSPTVLAASPAMLLKTHRDMMEKVKSPIRRMIHAMQTRSLTQVGAMPGPSSNDSLRPAIGNTPGKLGLVFVTERAGAGTETLSSSVLSDLRIFTGARIIYALSAAKVAGAVSQPHIHDYRVDNHKCSHFGTPTFCTEILLRDKAEYKTTDEKVEGEIIVRGPCVSGGEAAIGVIGTFRDDYTIAYVEE